MKFKIQHFNCHVSMLTE